MKKIIFSLICVGMMPTSSMFTSSLSAQHDDNQQDYCFTTAVTAGFVFKPGDCTFKKVYGRGIIDAVTVDNCYYFWKPWGVGVKVSYWQVHGCTTFLKQRARAQEIPLTFYVRGVKDFECGLQLYASLGGGVTWLREKSYLGRVRFHKGIGEVEGGFNYPLCGCFNITGAVRYLFPSQWHHGRKNNIGGVDLRAGIAFVY